MNCGVRGIGFYIDSLQGLQQKGGSCRAKKRNRPGIGIKEERNPAVAVRRKPRMDPALRSRNTSRRRSARGAHPEKHGSSFFRFPWAQGLGAGCTQQDYVSRHSMRNRHGCTEENRSGRWKFETPPNGEPIGSAHAGTACSGHPRSFVSIRGSAEWIRATAGISNSGPWGRDAPVA